MSIVNVEKVSRIYRQDSIAVKALDEVSVAIEAGEFTTLVGPSGSGKTTLLNQIGALDEPDSGRIQVAGEEITGLSRKKRTLLRLWKIGFVFQEYNLIGVLSAQENVEYVLMLRGVPFRERRAEAQRILVEVGLQGLEASNSVSRWRGRLSASLPLSWPTSPRPISIPRPAGRCWT